MFGVCRIPALILILILILANSVAGAVITATDPAGNAKSASRSTNVQATADSNIESSTVTQSSFRVQGNQTGRINGSYSASGMNFQLDPTNNLKPGELVRATATSQIQNTSAVALDKRVWQFTAATAPATGAMKAHSTPSFGGGDSTSVALGDLDGDGDVDIIIANYFTNPAQTVWLNDGTGVFTANGSFGTTQHTFAIGLGDLDNDGDLDAVTAHQSSPPGAAIAWLNDGTGAFTQQGTAFGAGYITYDLALGDLDGDGDLDCILANSGGAAEEVFLNDGLGTFSAHPGDADFGAGKSQGIDLGDVDGDGDLDAVVANTNSELESVWKNDGTGVFTAGDTFGGSDSTDVILGDLDNDGDLDAVVSNYNDQDETVWTNDGTGDFSAKSTFGTAEFDNDFDVVLGDLDGDGDLDCVTTTSGAGQNLWMNDGDGDFIAHATIPNVGLGLGELGQSVALADLDGDGDLDMVVANDNDAAERVYLNTSITVTPLAVTTTEAPANATFTVVLEAAPASNVDLQITTSDNTEGRLSTDGVTQQDSVTLTFTSANWSTPKTVTVHGQDDAIDDGHIPYTLTTSAAVSTDPVFSGSNPADVSATNTDNDTAGVTVSPGTVTVSESGTTANFSLSLTSEPVGDVVIDVASTDTGEATVSPTQRTFTSGNWSTPQSITVTGIDDATVDGNETTTLNVTMNTGATADPLYDAIDPDDVVATTLDDDFVVTSTSPVNNAKSVPRTTNVAATVSGTVQPATVTETTYRVQGDLTGRIAGATSGSGTTLTLDPTNDLQPGEWIKVTATSGILGTNGSVLVPEVWQFMAAAGVATGVITPHATTPSFGSDGSEAAALGDLDGDGDLDALVSNGGGDAERVWFNDGSGGFTTSATFFASPGTTALALGDLDGDGDLDAVITAYTGYTTVWNNGGTGNFSAHPTTPFFGSPTAQSLGVALGDLDADGDLDAVIGGEGQETVWLNDGTGSFSAHPVTPSFGGDSSSCVQLGDLDGDGDLDAIVSNRSPELTSVWVNDGSGSLSAHSTFDSGRTIDFRLGDLDGDGDLDAVFANNENNAETVFVNQGTGTFVAQGTFGSGDSFGVALGDVDGDGDLDAAIANFGASDTIWLNNGSGAFTLHGTFNGGDQSTDVRFGDLDGDNDVDLFVANGSGAAQAETVWINRNPPGINVSPTSGLATTEASGTATFTVVLASQPIADVSVQLDTSDTTEGRLSTDGVTQQDSVTITFTSANWATPRTITLHGQNDAVDDGNISYTITTGNATSTDPMYSAFVVADVSASNTDDDTAGVTVSVGAWTQLFPTGTAPSARNASGAYDAAKDRLMFFSGNTGSSRPQDTWVLARATGVSGTPFWQQLSPTGGPPQGRSLHRSVYSESSNRMILYGGCTASCGAGLSDAWVLSNANGLTGTPNWVSLPSGVVRNAYAVGYDEGNRRMMVYGGLTATASSCMTNEQVLSDADGVGSPAWTVLSPGSGPGPRGQDVNGAYDSVSNRLIVFGGYDCSTSRNDLWVLNNANGLGGAPSWSQLSPTGTAPTGRSYHTTAYDPNTNRLIIFGGTDGVSSLNEVWLLTNANGVGGTPQWIKSAPSGASPAGRAGHLFGYSPTSNRMVIGYGSGAGFYSDVWVLSNANGMLTVSESATTATFTVVLDSEPVGTVVIDVSSPDEGEATVSPAQLTFTSGDWSTPKTVTVTGVNDAIIDGNQQTTISVSMNTTSTTDPLYDAIDPNDVLVTTVDDDFVVTTTSPAKNAPSASQTTNIEATVSGAVQSSSVTESTYRVQGELSGRIAGTTSGNGTTISLDPATNLKPGETVKITATSGLLGSNNSPLVPEVWQFTAAAGTASGVFIPHATAPTFGSGNTHGVALGDLDGDGDLDAIVANTNDQSDTVWKNDGGGTFTLFQTFGSGTDSGSVALGDLDNDGDLDALMANVAEEPETVWKNDGNGTFTEYASFGGQTSYDVALGDLDGDGDLDALIGNFLGGNETVWLNDGSGGFSAHPEVSALPGGSTLSVALGDLDNDGDLDALVSNVDADEKVYLNDGRGVLTPGQSFAGASGPNGMALGDLDGDGDLDVVFANDSDNPETVWMNDGTGVFSAHSTVPSFGQGKSVDIALGDLDGDGDLDALVANYITEAETVWLNDGTGAFSEHPKAAAFGGDDSYALALGDLDGDGDLDALIGNFTGGTESVWLNRDAPGINVSPTSGLTTTEAGATATFTAVLGSQPVADVTVQLDTSDATEGRISTDGVTQQDSVTLTFTSVNWATPQTITLHGQNDAVDDGNLNYTITTGNATSVDPLYSGFVVADVSASNSDDDTVGVTVSVGAWTQLFPTGTAPAARTASGAYDADNDRLMFFSGNTGPSRPQDTWVLARATGVSGTPFWQQLFPTGGPPQGRSGHRAVYGASSNRMILYGGCTVSCGVGLSDAWALTNANGLSGTPGWVSLPDGLVRNVYAVGYDTTNRRMMVYGGMTAGALSCMTNERVLSDADGVGSPAWNVLSPGAGPGARGQDVNGAYDPVSNRLIVFGGFDCSNYRNDLWVLNNANGLGGAPSWSQLTPTGTAPTGRSHHTSAYDPNTNRLIVFGGTDGVSSLNEVWLLTNANGVGGTPQWIESAPAGAAPVGRAGHFFGYSPTSNRMVIGFGSGAGYYSDVWVLSNANGMLTVSESATTAMFTVVLDSEPVGTVVIDVSSPDEGEVTVSPAQLTFTSGDWSTPKTVTVTGANDGIIDGNQQTTISVSMNTASTTDPLYDAIDPNDVLVTTIDDDFVVTATNPVANAKAAPRSTNVGATTSGSVQSSTVTQWTYRIQGDLTGRITGSTSGSGTTISLDPAGNLKPGETIKITATNGILGPNDSGLVPRVWQFTAAAEIATGAFIPHASTPLFGGGASFETALGDLDGDGDLDAVVANYSENDETVWLNDGLGNFTAGTTFNGGNLTIGIALGDLDGDGDLDVVTANGGSNAERVLLNDGAGVFSPHSVTDMFGADDSNGVSLGDLDGDGDLDAVTANYVSLYEKVWLNDGTGLFTPHPTTPSFGLGLSGEVALGDIDADGDLDAIVASGDDVERVFRNDGAGNFSAFGSFDAGASVYLALGDVDGDGDLDAVAAGYTGAETVWLNDGSGLFSAGSSFGGAMASYGLALGDLDGDGDLDVIVANTSEAETVWLNDGSGTFSAHSVVPSFSGGDSDVVLGDIDGDGDLDAVVSHSSAAESVWINRNPAGITVSPTSGLTTTEAGGTVTFTVVLDSQPIADVTLQLDTSDSTEGRLSTDGITQQDSVTLTFTSVNWATPQTITLHGQNDAVDDGEAAFTVTTAAATSADAYYNGLDAGDVSASNTDDDTAGVTVSVSAWTQLFPTGTAPAGRAGTGASYDVVNDRVMFFGGNTGPTRPQDTWVLARATGAAGTPFWQQLSPTGGPPAGRSLHRSVYAESTNQMILYGGCTANCGAGLSDAWVLNNANGLTGTPSWTSLPSGANRHGFAVGYDPSNRRMMVYGGLTHIAQSCMTNEQVLTDADGTGSPAWSALSPGAGPGPRGEDVNGAYDPGSNRLIVFGGYDCSSNRNDLWVLNNANGLGGAPSWSQLTPTGTAPTGRSYHTTAYDPNTNRLIVFGGTDGVSSLNEVWLLTNANGVSGTPQWIKSAPAGASPVERASHLFGYSPASNRMVIGLGSNASGYLSDVWVLSNANGMLTVSESATIATFTVVLDSEPVGTVVIDVSSPDEGEVTVSPAQLTFTSGDWSTPQTITVTGVNDGIIDGNQQTTISVSMNTTSTTDPLYDAIDPNYVLVTTIDDDFVVTATNPVANAKAAPRATNIEATASGAVQSSTVTQTTYRVQGEQTGRITGTYGASGTTLSFDPASNLKPGETIKVTATTGILGPNDSPLLPEVWQFRAAAGTATGVMSEHPTASSFGDSNSRDVALGDLNGDGYLDALVANDSSQSETVWINSGTGTFTLFQSFGTGDSTAVALGDLDGDGDLDAVVANTSAGAETVWLNDGTGTFSAGASFGAQDSFDVALGDIDADGDLDAVVANLSEQAETVWRNNGAGIFTPHLETPSFGASNSYDLELGDLDGDGDLDVLVGNYSSQAETVWLNDGAGNFTPHSTSSFGGKSTLDVALGDIDGDGDLDALLANTETDAEETVWKNDGTGVFTLHQTFGTPTNSDSTDIELVDLDGNGSLDVLVANYNGQSETAWLNNGSGTFTAHTPTAGFGTGHSFGMDTGDIDGDGDVDAVVANFNGQTESVWINRNSAGIVVDPTSGLTTTEAGGMATFTVVLDSPPVADVDVQLDTSDATEGRLSTDGVTQQTAVTLTFTSANWATPRTITLHGQDDPLDDGNINYAIATPAAVSADVLYSGFDAADVSASNTDDDTAGVTVSTAALTVAESGTSADFTLVLTSEPVGDVVIEVSSTDTGEATVSPAQRTFTSGNWSTPQTVTVTGVNDAILDGDQSTTVSVAMNAGATADPVYDALDPSDVTVTTTDDDFVIVSTSPAANAKAAPRATNIEATTSGTVQGATVTQTTCLVQGEQTGRIAGSFSTTGPTLTLDPANDLKPGELVRVTATNGILGPFNVPLARKVWQFTAASGTASGAFAAHPTTPSFGGDNSMDVALGDLDGDGDLDAFVANASGQAETVWMNDGAGNFSASSSFGAGDSQAVELGDLDADGDLDGLVGNVFPDEGVTVWMNSGTGAFTAHATPKFGDSFSVLATDLALGDIDGDGDLDVVVANSGSMADTVWLNDGSGVFALHPIAPVINAGVANMGIDLGDLDGDGDLDLVSANTLNQAETVLLNDGTGGFSAHPTTPSFGIHDSAMVALGDLDGDGDLDAIVASGDPNDPETVWLNDGNGNFSAHPTAPSFGLEDGFDVALGDLDGDGDLDAVIANIGGGDGDTVWLNDGTGTFTAHPSVPIVDQASSSPAVALGDLDGDGDLDLVFANESAAESVYLNRPPAGITVTPVAGLVTTEAGGTDAFTVVLTSSPLSNVDIQIDSSDPSEGRVSTDGVTQQDTVTLTFTTSNWSTAQTVTAHGQNDTIDDGSTGYTLTTAAASSTDPLYNGLASSDVSASNSDDDMAGVTVTPLSVTVSESGTTDGFTIVLATEPVGDVVIDLASSDLGEATVSPAQLMFTTADWATPKNVTVTGVNDAVTDGDQSTTIIVTMNSGATNDAVYDAIDPADVTATTTDDDIPVVAPSGFTATATSTSTVATSWNAVPGATSYEVWRTTAINVAYSLVSTTTSLFFNDSGLTANTTYLYKVRTNGLGGPSAFSPVDVATTTLFTDPALSTATPIKAVHITELRTAVQAMRAAGALTPASFTDSTPISIKRVHIVELRTALDAARSAIGLNALSYTDPAIVAGTTKAKVAHVAEPRAGTQ